MTSVPHWPQPWTAETFVAVYDADDKLRYASAAFKHLFQLDSVDATMTFDDLIKRGALRNCGPRIDCGVVISFIAEMQKRRRQQAGQRCFATDTLDGGWYWMTETVLENGWIIVIGSEISPLKHLELTLTKAHSEALNEARTDFLTGLPNRRHILSYLDILISTLSGSHNAQTPLSIAVADLDRFKSINENFGHLVGDDVLRDFAHLARTTTRRSDVIGRVGGEEFLVVMPGTTTDDAKAVLERLRRAVEARLVPVKGGSVVRYTLSVGITQVSPADSVDGAIGRADASLYKSKKLGRNRISVDISVDA
ncbi:GGDEF domain-containing protein [Caballeronia sp. M23-90]